MVAVADEVDLSQFVDGDGWKVDVVNSCCVNVLPAILKAGIFGVESG